ncbi:hypothetical protein IAD21_04931 [Abditibacteriota bacterium]|nr:hypothetical protein IAD21_04931 [Abditibacteriota bacterium]
MPIHEAATKGDVPIWGMVYSLGGDCRENTPLKEAA